MTRTVRLFMLVEATSFTVASIIHSGGLVVGYEHYQASVAEGVIATVLFIGLALTFVRPASLRAVGLTAQLFALLGTLVGVFTIAVGIGPRTVPDLVYHAAILGVLVWGLIITMLARSEIVDQQA